MNNEKIVLTAETLDDESAVINFDVCNIITGDAIKFGGYVMSRIDENDKCFYVTVFNGDGDVLSETTVPFDFKKSQD
jgi:hypothetical protein